MESIERDITFEIMLNTKCYKNRMIQTLAVIIGLVAGIIVYVSFFTVTGIGVPCIFHSITGMLCPGCGMTHAMSSIAQGKLLEAIGYNALSLTVCPFLAMFLLVRAFKFIKTGQEEFSVIEILFLIICLVICVWYFLLRNNLI